MGESWSSDQPGRYEDLARFFGHQTTEAHDRSDVESIGEAFDLIEEDFGRFLDESLSPRGAESLYDLVGQAEPPQQGGVAVDVGCGDGRDAVQLALRFGLRVHGIDPSAANIAAARERAAAQGLTDRLDLQVGRAEGIPLPDQSVDVVWCKEVLTFTELEAAMSEFHRVMRPTGFGVLYQVVTGPAMSEDEARWFNSHEAGFGPSHGLRPADVEAAIATAGLVVRQRVDYASEWGEAGQERSGAAGRRLIHAARLLRQPDRYIARYGETNYQIMLVDCLWHVYRMIGKLWGVAFVVERS